VEENHRGGGGGMAEEPAADGDSVLDLHLDIDRSGRRGILGDFDGMKNVLGYFRSVHNVLF